MATFKVIVLIILTPHLKKYYLGVYFYLAYIEKQKFNAEPRTFCNAIESSLTDRGLKGLSGKQRL